MAKEILIYHHMHWDPTWRRCFDKPAKFKGVSVRSYAEVEAFAINRFLELAPQGVTFSEGQAVVWRKFLKRNKDKKELLQELAKNGQLTVMLAGETVQDSVMPTAEGLVRNFLVAQPFYRDFVGDDHPGLKIAWLEDAFGNSPNLPQVLKGVGAEAVSCLSYQTLDEDVWVGIDGTRLPQADRLKSFVSGTYTKHPPCDVCQGAGCDACDQLGMVVWEDFQRDHVEALLAEAMAADADVVRVCLGSEEVPTPTWLPEVVKEFNAGHGGKCTARFAGPVEVYEADKARLEQALAERDNTPSRDLNPAMPGCLVSRIDVKQRIRKISYWLVLAEAQKATRTWKQGQPEPLPKGFAKAWQNVTFCQFHDAVTGTHIDSAAREIERFLDEAETIANRHYLVPDASMELSLKEVTDFPATAGFGDFEITFDRDGIRKILKDGNDVFGECPHTNRTHRPMRIGELALDWDVGDAWGQRIPKDAPGANLQLGRFNEICWLGNNILRWRGTYTGNDIKVKQLSWIVTARLSDDGKRIDFVVDTDWDTCSRRLRVVIPVDARDNTATYEVPFGFIDRDWDPDKLDFSQWNADHREFGTLHWVRKAVDDKRGVALLNKGLPCNRWMPNRLDLSLLRSPEWHFCIVEPSGYEFWDIDGQRDTGWHRFEYSIYPYYDGLSFGDLTRTGYEYNLPGHLEVPFFIEGDVVVTAWKPAEDGSGWILRLQDAGGRGTDVNLAFDEKRSVTPTDLLERPIGDRETGMGYRAELHKHGIMTLLIQ